MDLLLTVCELTLPVLALIGLGIVGILPPATSAMLHNLSTLGVSLHSMSALPVAGQATKVLKDL